MFVFIQNKPINYVLVLGSNAAKYLYEVLYKIRLVFFMYNPLVYNMYD